jgi:hypothetical protein
MNIDHSKLWDYIFGLYKTPLYLLVVFLFLTTINEVEI